MATRAGAETDAELFERRNPVDANGRAKTLATRSLPVPRAQTYFAYFERGSFFAACAEDAGRSCFLACRTSFEPPVADVVEVDGQIGLTNSIRHIGPPTNSADSDFTNAWRIAAHDPNVRVRRGLAEHRGDRAGYARNMHLHNVMHGCALGPRDRETLLVDAGELQVDDAWLGCDRQHRVVLIERPRSHAAGTAGTERDFAPSGKEDRGDLVVGSERCAQGT